MPTPSHILITVKNGSVPSEPEDFIIDNVQIEAFQAEPEMASDSMTPQGTRMNITATGLMSHESWLTVQEHLARTGNRCVKVHMPHPSSADELLIDLEAEVSDVGGPFVKMTGTQVIGDTVVLVRLEITDRYSLCNSPIVSHVWTQRWAIDGAGHSTRTVQGTITISRGNTSTAPVPPARGQQPWTQTIPWADIFRRAIIPPLPAYGWRRESQDFAYDAQGIALIYTITDKQYAHDLPDGVRVGDMEFSYERSLENPAIANCTFSCDLQGEPSLRNLDYAGTTSTRGNRHLVTAAVQLSKTRINAVYGHCLITRMRVTEKNILSGYSIRFEMDAQMFPEERATTNLVAPMAWMIGRGFTVTRTTSRELDAFGSATRPVNNIGGNQSFGSPELYVMLPHYLDNAVSGMACEGTDVGIPHATVYVLDAANPALGTITITTIEGDSGFGPINDPQSGQGFNGKYYAQMQQGANQGGYLTVVSHSVSITKVRTQTGLCRLTSMYVDAPDHVFQVTKPRIEITERIEVSRVNKSPPRVARPLPVGSYVVSEDWDVSYGRFDAQGNRIFTGVFERTYAMYDTGGTPNDPEMPTLAGFYSTVPQAGIMAGDTIRGWMAVTGYVNSPFSPLGTDATQATGGNVFTVATDLDVRYAVPKLPLYQP